MADESPNPLGSLPNQPSLPNLPPSPAVAPQPPPPPVPQPNPAQVAQAADDQHHSLLGRTFRSLMGNEVNYQVDPQTGKLVQTQTEQKAGQLWRSMLAGVLLGGATASKNHATDFAGGMAQGAEGVVQDKQRQDLVKREQARQQFEDSLKARQANTEEDLRHAQIAMHNAQTLRENQLTQFDKDKHDRDTTEWKVKWPLESFKLHTEASEMGKTQLKPYIDAGIPYFQKDKSESEMLALDPDALKEHQKYLWEPTGVRMGADKEGNPTWETTYSAVDPKGQVAVTKDNIKAWGPDAAALDAQYGKNFFEVLKPGSKLTAQQYMAVTQREQEVINRRNETKKTELLEDKVKAEIGELRARTAEAGAKAKLTGMQIRDTEESKKALALFTENKGDLSKITDPKQRASIQQFYLKELAEDRGVYQTAVANGQQEEAKEQYKKILGVQSILDQFGGVKPAAPTSGKSGEAPEPVRNITELMQQDSVRTGGIDAYDYIMKRFRGSDKDRDAAIKQHALVPWPAVVDRAERDGITRKRAFQKFKDEGFKVQGDPSEDMATAPLNSL